MSEDPLPGCLLCGSSVKRCFVVNGCAVLECVSCGHRFTPPPERARRLECEFGDDYFFGGGSGYDNYLDEEEILVRRGVTYAKLLSRHGPPGRVLDVGSAAGFLLRGLVDEGWEGVGVEPNQTLSDIAVDRSGVDSRCLPIEEFESSEPFDAAVLVQVIAHVVVPPMVVGHVARLLKPGGLLLIETWDRNSWVARLLGSKWHEYSPPNVLQWFTRPGLARLCEQQGLETIATGRPKRWIQAGHAKSLLRYKYGRVASASLGWIPDGLSLPYPGDDLFWHLARKTG